MERPPPLATYQEIANIEHRPTALRDKQGSYTRQSDLAKRVTWIAIPIAATLIALAAFATQRDPVPMLVFFSILLGALAIVAWLGRGADWSMDIGHFGALNRYTSHQVFLEESIQECEKALAG